MPDRAGAPTTERDGLCSCLRRHEQVARSQASARDVSSPEDEEAVRAGRRRSRRTEIREVGRAASPESRRHEADGLDADVSAGRQSRVGKEACAATGREGVDPAGAFGYCYEPTGISSERTWSDRQAALDRRRTGRDDAIPAAAVERVERGRPGRRGGHEQAMERARPVDGDPGGERPRWLTNGWLRPSRSTRSTPGAAPGLSTKTSSRWNEHRAPGTTRPCPSAR